MIFLNDIPARATPQSHVGMTCAYLQMISSVSSPARIGFSSGTCIWCHRRIECGPSLESTPNAFPSRLRSPAPPTDCQPIIFTDRRGGGGSASPTWGVAKSLELVGAGPVALLHTQKIGIQSEKPTWTKALEFTQFTCPCGTDPRLLLGEQRTSDFKLVTSVDDPKRK